MVVRSNSEPHGVLQPIYRGRSFIGVSLALQFTCASAKSNILQTIRNDNNIVYKSSVIETIYPAYWKIKNIAAKVWLGLVVYGEIYYGTMYL